MKVTMFVRQWLTDVVDSSPQHSTLRILRICTQRHASTFNATHLRSTPHIYTQRHASTLNASHLRSTPHIYTQRHASTLNASHPTLNASQSTPQRHNHERIYSNRSPQLRHHNYVTTTTSPRTPTRLLVSSCMLHTRYSMYNTHRTMLSLALVLSDLCRASRISICASCTHTFALVA